MLISSTNSLGILTSTRISQYFVSNTLHPKTRYFAVKVMMAPFILQFCRKCRFLIFKSDCFGFIFMNIGAMTESANRLD